MVQTFIIACCNIAFSGGFSLQLGALSRSTWEQMNMPTPMPGDSPDVSAKASLGCTNECCTGLKRCARSISLQFFICLRTMPVP